MTGLLSSVEDSINGLLGKKVMGIPVGLMLGIPQSEEQLKVMLAGGPEKMDDLQRRQRQRQLEQLQLQAAQMQMEQAQKAQGKDDLTGAMIQSMNLQMADATQRLQTAIANKDKAGVEKAVSEISALKDPQYQNLLRGHLATQGNLQLAEQAGMIDPLQQPAAPTNKMREYEYARQNGFKGSFTDFMQLQGGTTPGLFAPTVTANPDGTFSMVQAANRPGMPPVVYPLSGSPVNSNPDLQRELADAKASGTANAGLRSTIPLARSTINDARAAVEKLASEPGLEGAYGAIQGRLPSVRQDVVNADAARARLIGVLSLQAREKLKGSGAISDYEAKTLENSVSTLANPLLGDDAVKAEIARVMDILSSADARLQAQESQLSPQARPAQRLRYNPQTGAFE